MEDQGWQSYVRAINSNKRWVITKHQGCWDFEKSMEQGCWNICSANDSEAAAAWEQVAISLTARYDNK